MKASSRIAFLWVWGVLGVASNAGGAPLDLAKRSAELVRTGDRRAWLELYGPGSTVEDPVGTLVHSKEAERLSLETFWEVFIAPNEIVFESHLDLDRPELAIRDVTIHTKSPSGLKLAVPAFVMYRPHPEDPTRVGSMRAFWEVRDQFRKAKEAGEQGKETSNAMLKRIFHFEGLPGIFGFAKGFFTPVKTRREALLELFGDVPANLPEPSLNGLPLSEEALQRWSGITFGKLLVSGPEAVARIQVGSSGVGSGRGRAPGQEGFLHVTFGAGRTIRTVDFYF